MRRAADATELLFVVHADRPVVLHWGLSLLAGHRWHRPPPDLWPAGTRDFDDMAVQTTVSLDEAGRGEVPIRIPADLGFGELCYVFHFPESGRWDNNHGRDYRVALPGKMRVLPSPVAVIPPAATRFPLQSRELQGLAEEIVEAETSNDSWTLMHRFERCADLLSSTQGDPDAMALLFVWLRYSAIRQLDWQRRYNTQPQRLTHAQDRLTRRVAELYRKYPGSRPWARLLLTTVGRGGHGQRIRDDILHLMHRHKIKEDPAYFMEQWHQKLHNNATPDDIAICKACLALLRASGDVEVFHEVLEEQGVTRERLRSYDRPITTHPCFPSEQREGLIRDFEDYLRLLKSIHGSTDLQSAVEVTRDAVSAGLLELLDSLLPPRAVGQTEKTRREDSPVPAMDILGLVSRARKLLAQQIESSQDDGQLRDLLYLDLALVEHMRLIVEGLQASELSPEALSGMIRSVAQDLALSCGSPELAACARHWRRLRAAPETGDRDWALHAKSVTDRMARAVASEAQSWLQVLQPKAEVLGAALGVDRWTIPRFAEQVVRGGPLFALGNLLRRLDPILRGRAELGPWQIICSAEASGQVRVAESLLALQGASYQTPTIVVTDTVGGEEEIPRGVKAVITSDFPDLMSHVAVRARNSRVLFATCFDCETYEDLKRLEGRYLQLQVTSTGDVVYEESPRPSQEKNTEAVLQVVLRRPTFSAYAVASSGFDRNLVGAKSSTLAQLRGKMPCWLRIPSSMALPFGAFEQVLEEHENSGVRKRYERLLESHDQDPSHTLQELRETVLDLHAPLALTDAIGEAAARENLPVLEQWEASWRSIKTVWASKWTDRAYHSRVSRRIAHHDLFMAVLIQEVVPADYAFVTHTVNPFNGDPEEIYAEVVLGLGETLVGNLPGRALSFVCRKNRRTPVLLSYPSKSIALHGSGLIFRSDSNGEDLADYAGAGLYESVTATPLRQAVLDYSHERLVWDDDLRHTVLLAITDLSLAVEQVQGTPQDIEGAVSNGVYYVLQARPQVGL